MIIYLSQMALSKIVLGLLLVSVALGAYNTSRAHKLINACAATLATEAEINSWTCKYCSEYKLINTKAFNNSILDIYGYTGFSPDDNAVVIAFRSTVSLQNWVVELDASQVPYPHCSGCQVHQGFYNAFAGVEGYIRNEVQKLLALYRDSKIFVIGHSLGSALATIGALDIKLLFGHVEQLYTFGEPRVGNQAFANYVTSSIGERFRVIHYSDIVPHLPPQIPIPYAHFANEVWYDDAMKTYKICGAEEFRCSKSLLPTSWSLSANDINNYLKLAP